jgi:DNA-binding MarR family transcriptional regulator
MAEVIAGYRAMQLGSELFDEAAAERLGVNRTDLRAMDVISQRGALTAGALAEEIRLSRPATTAALDRLEKLGYVRRVPDSDDRRRILVELTPLAMRRSEEIWGGFIDYAERAGSHYTVAELEAMRRFTQEGIEETAAQRERLESLPPPRRRDSAG